MRKAGSCDQWPGMMCYLELCQDLALLLECTGVPGEPGGHLFQLRLFLCGLILCVLALEARCFCCYCFSSC